jgi:hypothetical protein
MRCHTVGARVRPVGDSVSVRAKGISYAFETSRTGSGFVEGPVLLRLSNSRLATLSCRGPFSVATLDAEERCLD